MSIFDGIESTSYFSRSKNIVEGTHTLIGKSFVVQASAKNRAVQNFIAEFTVVDSTSADLAPGDTVSAVYSSSNQSFLRNVKYLMATYMMACERTANPNITLAEVDAKITGEYLKAITDGDGTAYAGIKIKSIGRVTTIKTGPNAGQPFTSHEWEQAE
jgi:hypothetical protein